MARPAALALRGTGPALALWAATPAGAAEVHLLRQAGWRAPTTVAEAAARPALSGTLAAFVADDGQWVRLAHGGGAAGSDWAHEVRAWLVTLGIPGDRMQLDPGMADPGRLRLTVHAGEERL